MAIYLFRPLLRRCECGWIKDIDAGKRENTGMARESPKTAISYVHGYRDDEVLGLSSRLRGDGVDCEIDLYEPAPEIGWGRWMAEMMTQRIVLVTCSEAYNRRYHLQEEPGVGLGATFESGLLVQRVLESQGRNRSIIPLLLASGDARFIPEFLKDVTRYDLSREGEYENLLRRLTNQPAVPRPPIGAIPDLPPRATAPTPTKRRNLVLFKSEASGLFGMPLIERERSDRLRLTVAPDDHSDVAKLRALKNERHHFSVAYGLTASFVRFSGLRETLRDGEERIEIDLAEIPFDNSYGTEMSYNGISADQLAEMRARRILLDERLPQIGSNDWAGNLNQMTLESFVSGSSSIGDRLAVKSSPIPAMVNAMPKGDDDVIPATKLLCVMLLILSGVVEHISRLDMELRPDGVRVDFEGIRHKVYSNVQAPRIAVSGVCPVGGTTAQR